jgi:hypothetical protein
MFSFNWISGVFGSLFSDFEDDSDDFPNCFDINPATGFLVCDGFDGGGNPYGIDLSDDDSSFMNSDDWFGDMNDFSDDSFDSSFSGMFDDM